MPMATNGHDGSARTQQIYCDLASHGYAGNDVRKVYVEVSSDANDSLLAIIAAGEAGRYSFDFRVESGRVDIQRAYEEGMRVDEEQLPDWMAAVRQEIETGVLN